MTKRSQGETDSAIAATTSRIATSAMLKIAAPPIMTLALTGASRPRE